MKEPLGDGAVARKEELSVRSFQDPQSTRYTKRLGTIKWWKPMAACVTEACKDTRRSLSQSCKYCSKPLVVGGGRLTVLILGVAA